jgi:hypothetical protein
MTVSQQRAVMVTIAVVGALHEIYARQRVVSSMTEPLSARATQYHAAAQLYGRCARWFVEQALRAEQSYYAELSK